MIFLLANSHYTIGKTIHKYILDNVGVNLSLSDIRYGCIIPDFKPRFISIPHYKSKSFETVAQMILSLQNSNFYMSSKQMSSFSTDLGVILHYITDYFCYPHNDAKTDKMPYHIFYEIALNRELKKYLASPSWMMDMSLEAKGLSKYRTSVIDLIEEKHNQYLKETPSLLNDVIYGLQCCCMVASKVINSAVLKAA